MKTAIYISGLLFFLSVYLMGQQPMHPNFQLLDKNGTSVLKSSHPLSLRKTCGKCHNVSYIEHHSLEEHRVLAPKSTHSQEIKGEVNCFLCHLANPHMQRWNLKNIEWAPTASLLNTQIVYYKKGSYRYNPKAFQADDKIKINLLPIQAPTSENCGICHGIVHCKLEDPVSFKKYFQSPYTQTTGQIFSSQRISYSAVNFQGKEKLHRPWDIHAQRMLECRSCHYPPNHPGFSQEQETTKPRHLRFDGRKISIHEYLRQPNHKFKAKHCIQCHDPEQEHEWLPYKERHIQALSCETCHIPTLYAPAQKQIDETVLTLNGHPLIHYRGVQGEFKNPDIDLVQGYSPTWLRNKKEWKFSSYNFVTHWFWVDANNKKIPSSLLKKAYFQGKKYRKQIIEGFDQNKDGKLEKDELILNTPQKEKIIQTQLKNLGVKDPKIVGELQAFEIHHNVIGEKGAIQNCAVCHSKNSKIVSSVELASYLPGNKMPDRIKMKDGVLEGQLKIDSKGKLVYQPYPTSKGLYLLGCYRAGWADILGVLSFFAVLCAISIHSSMRFRSRKNQKHHTSSSGGRKQVYLYSLYERLWHWIQALAILMLLLTGLEIHLPDTIHIFGFRMSIYIHNFLGILLLINAFLAAFYHLATGEIRQYLPEPKGFINQAIVQAKYYLHGMFQGESHPFTKMPERKLNPLQQITYTIILNILLPLQIFSGVLLWISGHWPTITQSFYGLDFIASIHSLGAWLFASFIVMHIYLTTTGPTPLTYIKAMLGGWEEIEE